MSLCETIMHHTKILPQGLLEATKATEVCNYRFGSEYDFRIVLSSDNINLDVRI